MYGTMSGVVMKIHDTVWEVGMCNDLTVLGVVMDRRLTVLYGM